MDNADYVMPPQFYPVRLASSPQAPDPLWTRLCVFCCNAAIQGHEKKLMANPGSDSSASFDYDYVIIGSGFGGSVSALRLSEKGYRVLVLEKGMRLGAADFPKSNWDLKRWLWLPSMRCFGLFKLTFFRHVGVLSGVGVGGGSLVYANTLPIPKKGLLQFAFVGPSGRLGDGAATALPDGLAHARGGDQSAPGDRRYRPARAGAANRHGAAFRSDQRLG